MLGQMFADGELARALDRGVPDQLRADLELILGPAIDPTDRRAVSAWLEQSGVFGVRPVLVRYRESHKSEILASGAEAMIGQTATVVEATAGRQAWGHVRIGGESWPAVSSDGSPLQEGEEVVVKELRNTSLVVSPTRLGKRPGHS